MRRKFEAPVGFEPTNKGFADLPLRPLGYSAKIIKSTLVDFLSGKRDSNPRHQPWQGCALPAELFPHISFLKFFNEPATSSHWDCALLIYPPQTDRLFKQFFI